MTEENNYVNIKQFKKYNYIFFFDCEYTCWENSISTLWSDPKYPSEIIQFGIVIYDLNQKIIANSYESFVKPKINFILSDYCKDLLKFSQKTINISPSFNKIAKNIYEIVNKYSEKEFFICSWGDDYNRVSLNAEINKTIDPFSNCKRLDLMKEFNKTLKLNRFISSREQIKNLISYRTKINRHNALDDSIELIDLFTILVNLDNNDGFLQPK